jgi:putative nucleotidyltransferase with HDIG domain
MMQKIAAEAEPIYRASKHYRHTIWPHALGVANYAKVFAAKLEANQFVAEAGGLLHDIGAAKFGKENHHIAGVCEASSILLKCECPLEFVGPIVSTIYSHRGSQKIAFQIPEAICVAAADAKDHFENVGELWLVHARDLGVIEAEIFQMIFEKLARDWEKTDPRIQALLDGTYERARQKLVKIANGDIVPKERGCSPSAAQL